MLGEAFLDAWDANNGTVNSLGKVVNAPMFAANDILKWAGLSNLAANILSGMGPISRLFGRKDPEVESQGIEGTLNTSGFSGDLFANILEKGGLFRSDKRYTQTSSLSANQDAALDNTMQSMIVAVNGFAAAIGIDTDSINGYSKQVKLALTGDATKDQEVIAKLFSDIGDELSNKLAPNLSAFTKSGESASATLQRLAADFKGTDQVAQLLGWSASSLFGATGMASATAREHLIDLAGGLSALSSEASFFNQNFLTDAERLKPVAEALDTALASLGLNTIPTTRDEFKALIGSLIDSGAAATDAGAKQLSSLLALAEAFAQVHPAVDAAAEAANAVAEAAAAAAKRAEEVAAALQAVKDSASMLLGGVDNAFSALQTGCAAPRQAPYSPPRRPQIDPLPPALQLTDKDRSLCRTLLRTFSASPQTLQDSCGDTARSSSDSKTAEP